MWIEEASDDLLSAKVDALVNAVNTVGVMGKGLALAFKKKFPDNFSAYQRACSAGEVVAGKMFMFDSAPRFRAGLSTSNEAALARLDSS